MKQMPCDIELEKEILGTAFVSSEAADKIISKCKPSDFSSTVHKEFYNTIFKMRKSKMKIDLVGTCTETNWVNAVEFSEIHHRGITDVLLDQHIYQLKPLTYRRKIQNIQDVEDVEDLYNEIQSDKQVDSNAKINPDDLKQMTLEYYQKGEDKGYASGWEKLDEYYRISKSQLTVLTGVPGSGKSEWLDAVCVNLAQKYKWKTMYFSPENFPVSRHARKLIEKYSGYPFFKGYNPRIQKNEIDKYIDWLNSYFVFLNPGIEHRNLDYLLNQVNDVDGFVLDPWNEVEHSRPEGMTETEYIGQALSKLKALAIRENIHVWVVAHPTKLQKTIEGLYPVPTPYDISGSANWRNKADNCISIYRNTNEHKIQVHIQKIRFKDNGKPGMIELKYDPVTGRFN